MSSVFMIEIPKLDDESKREEFQEAIDELHNAWNQEIHGIAEKLQITYGLASELWYLRQRSRYTQETEDRMIKCFRETGKGHFRCGTGEEEEELKNAGY